MSVAMAAIVWQSLERLPLVAGGLLLLLVASAGLYRRQIAGGPRGWRWVLPGLRGLALAALGGSLLKPVAVRPADQATVGEVLFLLDASRSMSVLDSGRSEAELVALADALGKIAPRMRTQIESVLSPRLQRLGAARERVVRLRADLDYSRLSGRGMEAATARVQAALSELMALGKAIAGEVGKLPRHAQSQRLSDLGNFGGEWIRDYPKRLERAAAAIADAQALADRELYRGNPAVRQACEAVRGMARIELARAAVRQLAEALGPKQRVMAAPIGEDRAESRESPEPESGRWHFAADGTRSDLAADIRRRIGQRDGAAPRAAVVLTDGRIVTDDDAVRREAAAPPPGPVVFTVNVAPRRDGAAAAVRDVSFTRVTAPRSAFSGQTIVIAASIRAMGYRGQTLSVTATVGEESATRMVTVADERTTAVEMPIRVTGSGAMSMRIDVACADPSGETTLENNTVRRGLAVSNDRLKVLMIGLTASREFEAVKSALAESAWVEVQARMLDEDEAGSGELDPLGHGDDVVMLFDVEVGSLKASQWESIRRLVADRGGLAVVVAVDAAARVFDEYASGSASAALLPYSAGTSAAWRIWPGDEPKFRLRAAGMESTGAPRGEGTVESDRRWSELPAFFRFLVLPTLKPTAQPILIERKSRQPVLVDNPVGAGHVLFMGAGETWRWRGSGQRDAERFWLDLIRYGSDRVYAGGSGELRVDVRPLLGQPGEPVSLRARWLDGDPDGRGCGAMLVREGEIVRREALTADVQAGCYQGSWSDLAAGRYEVRFEADEGGGEATTATVPLEVSPDYQREMANVSGADDLESLVRGSGGSGIDLSDLQRLPELLEESAGAEAAAVETRLWDSPYLYAFIAAALCAEWALRKRIGLP